jgi:hypothetical protein
MVIKRLKIFRFNTFENPQIYELENPIFIPEAYEYNSALKVAIYCAGWPVIFTVDGIRIIPEWQVTHYEY